MCVYMCVCRGDDGQFWKCISRSRLCTERNLLLGRDPKKQLSRIAGLAIDWIAWLANPGISCRAPPPSKASCRSPCTSTPLLRGILPHCHPFPRRPLRFACLRGTPFRLNKQGPFPSSSDLPFPARHLGWNTSVSEATLARCLAPSPLSSA